MVLRDGKVLIGKRKGSHGDGQWAWPGGHMQYMESFADCAKREVSEETGIAIDNGRFLRLMNLRQYAPRHYVDIALVADRQSGEPRVMEPERVEAWEWRDMDNLPQPLFAPLPSYILHSARWACENALGKALN
jgi:8-oxo-dGTP diphosphatase